MGNEAPVAHRHVELDDFRIEFVTKAEDRLHCALFQLVMLMNWVIRAGEVAIDVFQDF